MRLKPGSTSANFQQIADSRQPSQTIMQLPGSQPRQLGTPQLGSPSIFGGPITNPNLQNVINTKGPLGSPTRLDFGQVPREEMLREPGIPREPGTGISSTFSLGAITNPNLQNVINTKGPLGSPQLGGPDNFTVPKIINPVRPGMNTPQLGSPIQQSMAQGPLSSQISPDLFNNLYKPASSGGPDNLTLPNMSASMNSSPPQSAPSPLPSIFQQPMGGGFGQPMGGGFGQSMGGGGLKSVLDNYFSNFLTNYFNQNLK